MAQWKRPKYNSLSNSYDICELFRPFLQRSDLEWQLNKILAKVAESRHGTCIDPVFHLLHEIKMKHVDGVGSALTFHIPNRPE